MDIKWIEDFLALAEHGSFTKAAESRFVTQPAFSRRIRSLENWLGVDLVDRSSFPTRLTPLGEDAVSPMRDCLQTLYNMRSKMQQQSKRNNTLILSTQHSLGSTFIPDWYIQIAPYLAGSAIRVNASNLHDCIDFFLAGQSDFLLCYHVPNIFPELEQPEIVSYQIGTDRLIPVCSPSAGEAAENSEQMRLIGFPPESFFGRLIQQECLGKLPATPRFELVCETALTEGIKAMLLKDLGMSWLPVRLVEEELQRGDLVQLSQLPTVEMKIILYRHKVPRTDEVNAFWQQLVGA
ncbi:LysR family transcriptional regulator [Marinobacterium arenosum]|uniref:LysR family transcriptional regulator n=1 Tax=Marinobacterium arenosum TaxID=2862496 RepID=UPI001C97FF06|nr:LysR family transcriptional regulator [Marinobacterium arenosum]MBY4677097.1 LysR family transcriptional regulator [Marinobacterium arenosum]